jgi:hypothetical protein
VVDDSIIGPGRRPESSELVEGGGFRYFGGIKNSAIRADFLAGDVDAETAADSAAALLEENK